MAQSMQHINLKELLITDAELINRYLEQYNEFFIPATEENTFDPVTMVNETYAKSSEVIGQHQPIEVAICENDPLRNDKTSSFRIHLRIIDGRHRWRQSIKNNFKWSVKFYRVKDYHQYMLLRGHFDLKKDTSPMERIKFFENLCEYYEKELKIPTQDVCTAICNDFSPAPYHEATIRRYVPIQYKNVQMSDAGKEGRETRKKESISAIQQEKPERIRNEFARFRNQIEQLYKENEYLRTKSGVSYYSGIWYVVEVLRNDKNWSVNKIFGSIDEAIEHVKRLKNSAKITQVEEKRDQIQIDEDIRIIKSTISTNKIDEKPTE